jgi:adenine deaminase
MAKHRYNRREFMGLSGAGIAGLVGAQWPGTAAAAVDSQEPDLVVFNAKVYTVDPLEPRAEAFAVKAGKFVAVGSTEDVKALIGKRTQVFDARQATVVPGFIDAHNHAPGAILLYEVLVGNP